MWYLRSSVYSVLLCLSILLAVRAVFQTAGFLKRNLYEKHEHAFIRVIAVFEFVVFD